MSMIWYTSTDGTDWTLMKSPSTYKINWEDLDKDSYRSVITGNLIRDVIARRWSKMSMEWSLISSSDVSAICSAVNKGTVYFKMLSPAWGTGGFLVFKGYVSKLNAELVKGSNGKYKLTFNIVQMERASYQ